MAERNGITDEDEIERLIDGKSEIKLRVPNQLRPALQSIGLGEMLAPINILEAMELHQILISEEAWQDIEFEVALDSGPVVHVC